MLDYSIDSMISVLQEYANVEHAMPCAELDAEMERLVQSCAPLLREVHTLLRARRRAMVIAEMTAAVEKEYERCFKDDLPFDGDITFVTEQPPLPRMKGWSGPMLRANSREEAEARAAVLGLKIVGYL